MKIYPHPGSRIPRRTAIGLILAGATANCTQQLPRQAQPNEIRIGVIASLSGEAIDNGQSTVRATELAAQEINHKGGLAVGNQRYPIALTIADDQDEVDVAVNAARKLIYQDNVAAIVGPQYSRNAIPVAKFVESAQIPMISPVSTSPETTRDKRYVFRATFIDSVQGKALAQFTRHTLNVQTTAVLYDIASAYNQGVATVYKQMFEAEGGRVVAFESYTTGETDFQMQLTTIQQRHPDALFLPNYIHEVVLQVRQARQLGINAALLGADGWNGFEATGQSSLLEGAFYSDQYSPDTKNPKTRAFIQQYRQVYGQDPQAVAAATYDAMHLLFKAIQSQGKPDSESIRQGLSELGRYDGVTGTIEYRGTGDPLRSVIILQIKQGQPVFYQQVEP